MSADQDAIMADLDVSRETFDRLKVFADLLTRWNPRINLVSRNSLNDLWRRHIQDSVQVFRCVEPRPHWADLGSGGGFPGMICAILAREYWPDTKFTLVESDQRKSAFLRSAARECEANCTVISRRIEAIEPLAADILSARALADLPMLLSYCDRHLAPTGTALFPKGVSWKKEVEEARKEWRFDATPITSETEPQAVILKIEGVSRG
ncbi:MAG: 16S rRNA (guanine(527)-N(7))-methyltransferase RsmG [Ruegeria sp.]|uniref:16S rRNA (guanine(527)-N(7))-methyltransferase RsmG n=1 Tax=Ruegeria sp. TaxID=1879320 RepID=UPI00349EE31B